MERRYKNILTISIIFVLIILAFILFKPKAIENPALQSLYNECKELEGENKQVCLDSFHVVYATVNLDKDSCEEISEEIIRLRSHTKQAVKTLGLTVPVGRTIDFLLQEMFREINTIGSKANDIQISREVIRFKAELERIREQVQNVE